MSKLNKAADFLQNMTLDVPEPPRPKPVIKQKPKEERPKKPTPTRAGLKHIGGYFDLETVEKVAILRARLRLDNSELIKLAVDDPHRKHMAKRAFGDACTIARLPLCISANVHLFFGALVHIC